MSSPRPNAHTAVIAGLTESRAVAVDLGVPDAVPAMARETQAPARRPVVGRSGTPRSGRAFDVTGPASIVAGEGSSMNGALRPLTKGPAEV